MARFAFIDRWMVTSLAASVICMATLALVISFPAWPWTWILIAGEVVFIWMMLRHPEHWYRRTATGMIAAAVALVIPPMISAHANVHGIGNLSLIFDNSPWLSMFLVAGAMLLSVLDWISRQHQATHSPSQDATDSPPAAIDAQSPAAYPSFTGVVEAYLDGTVWRARMHAGSAADAKPFCPRHRVPLRPRPSDYQGMNWFCTADKCDYYRLMPKLSIHDSRARRDYLAYVYTEIERRVRNGTGYVICTDDASPHI